MKIEFRQILQRFLLVQMLCLAAVIGSAQALASIGLDRLDVTLDDGDRIPTLIWFPSDGPEALVNIGGLASKLSPNGELRDGQHGLILLMHGLAGSSLDFHAIAHEMAHAGYIVVSPMVPGDNFREHKLGLKTEGIERRMAVLEGLLDTILSDAAYANHIDQDRIILMGRDVAANSILGIQGVRSDYSGLQAACEHDPLQDICLDVDLDFLVSGKTNALQDVRVKANILMAPVVSMLDGHTIERLQIPTMILQMPNSAFQKATSLSEAFPGKSMRICEEKHYKPAQYGMFLSDVPLSVSSQFPDFLKVDDAETHRDVQMQIARDIKAFLNRTFPNPVN